MPIYEYYCPDNHRIYQFYAKTLAQGKITPRCPDGAGLRMEKLFSPFAVTGGGKKPEEGGAPPAPEDSKMESAMAAMEGEMAGMDENDPRAMGRMMRRMAELTGEKIGGDMEEVVRKLEEGADPESLEEQMEGGDDPAEGGGDDGSPVPDGRPRGRTRRGPPRRDPKLYDYESDPAGHG